MIKHIFRQPLVYFLLLGGGLFVLYEWVGEPVEDIASVRLINVDRDDVLTFMQYRSKAFNQDLFNRQLDEMTPDQLNRLIEELVKEEVLYREAKAQELDNNDYVIKRRLIQKMEFIANGVGDALTELNDEQLASYYAANRDDYYIKPHVTFTHVFYSRELHGDAQAKQLAVAKREVMNDEAVTFAQAIKYGDRFLYHDNYIERERDYVESHFGDAMAEAIFALAPNEKVWAGPLASPHGYHLVMLSGHQPGRYPELEEVQARVHHDAYRLEVEKLKQQAIQGIIDSYTVNISDELLGDKLPHDKESNPGGGSAKVAVNH